MQECFIRKTLKENWSQPYPWAANELRDCQCENVAIKHPVRGGGCEGRAPGSKYPATVIEFFEYTVM